MNIYSLILIHLTKRFLRAYYVASILLDVRSTALNTKCLKRKKIVVNLYTSLLIEKE